MLLWCSGGEDQATITEGHHYRSTDGATIKEGHHYRNTDGATITEGHHDRSTDGATITEGHHYRSTGSGSWGLRARVERCSGWSDVHFQQFPFAPTFQTKVRCLHPPLMQHTVLHAIQVVSSNGVQPLYGIIWECLKGAAAAEAQQAINNSL